MYVYECTPDRSQLATNSHGEHFLVFGQAIPWKALGRSCFYILAHNYAVVWSSVVV